MYVATLNFVKISNMFFKNQRWRSLFTNNDVIEKSVFCQLTPIKRATPNEYLDSPLEIYYFGHSSISGVLPIS